MNQISGLKSLRLHIGLFGRRNVGKSSLINALTEQSVSIVSSEPGTTTDPVEKSFEMDPVGPVVFVDTAGVDDEGELGDDAHAAHPRGAGARRYRADGLRPGGLRPARGRARGDASPNIRRRSWWCSTRAISARRPRSRPGRGSPPESIDVAHGLRRRRQAISICCKRGDHPTGARRAHGRAASDRRSACRRASSRCWWCRSTSARPRAG